MSLHLEIAQGLRVDDLQALQDKVRLRGGRLVVYAEVISAFVISARSYRVKWVASPETRIRAGIPSMVITLLLGWWAFLGPYRSVAAVIWNQRGGVDLTDALLRAHPGNSLLLGYADSSMLGAFQENVNRAARRICAGVVLLFTVGLVYLIMNATRR